MFSTVEADWQDVRHMLVPCSVLETHNVTPDPTWNQMKYYKCLARRNYQNFPSMGILVSHDLRSNTSRVLGKMASTAVRRSSEL